MSRLLTAGVLSCSLLVYCSAALGSVVFTAPSVSMPPTVTSGSGGPPTINDIGIPSPSPDVVPTSSPRGMRYTNREIKYTVAPGDLFPAAPPVMIEWAIQRPYSVTGSDASRRASGRINGEIEIVPSAGGDTAVFDNFSMLYRGFYTNAAGAEIPNTSRALETPTAPLSGSGSSQMFPSPGGKLKTPSGESGKGTLPVGSTGNLVGTVKIQFTPTNVGDMIIFRYPSSFEVFATEIPEPSTTAIAALGLLAAAFVRPRR